jgi:beta-glucosidase
VNHEIVYREGIQMGYRGVGATVQTPLFAFGSGMSYTNFRLENARRNLNQVTLDVTNAGKVAGTETVQVYAEYEGEMLMPTRALAGFAKVSLAPGVKKVVTVTLDRRLEQYWDTKSQAWRPYPGKVTYRVGMPAIGFR